MLVIALGGNAITPADGTAMYRDMRKQLQGTVAELAPVLAEHDALLVHGNGPQVGRLLREAEHGSDPLPLDVLVAETQGQIGYLLVQELARQDIDATAVVTRVVVDPDDASGEPSKPVGPWLTADEADAHAGTVERLRDTDPGFRRVVHSPDPRGIVELDAVRAVAGRTVPVCCGGGGVPVTPDGDGVEGVVDKDRSASLLGQELDADTLLLVTDIAAAERNYGTPAAEPIGETDPDELEELMDAGTFGEGSMKPKIEACIEFIRAGGDRAIVTDAAHVQDALAGEAGTRVTP